MWWAPRVSLAGGPSACLPACLPACLACLVASLQPACKSPLVCPPAGTQSAVCSLRHFIHWRHPAVLLEEMAPWEAQATVYQASSQATAACCAASCWSGCAGTAPCNLWLLLF